MMSAYQPQILVKAESRVYFGSAGELLGELLSSKSRVIVISDPNVNYFHSALSRNYDTILIGVGEVEKSLQCVERVYDRLIELGADRQTFILAIGGGIVTDVAGFAASTYMRGLKFGFVPTTLLSQVDASVGGKNGVNVGGFKNMVGTFNQPEFVVVDAELLKSLSQREFRAGLAEMIKSAIIGDRELFFELENLSLEQLQTTSELCCRLVRRAVEVKARIVEVDECEKGERRKLNLGHTIGHAIERWSDRMNHGEAVAVGIAVAAKIANKMGLLSADDCVRICRLLEMYGFTQELPIGADLIAQAVRKDKKNEGAHIHFVLPTSIGDCLVMPISIDSLGCLISNL